MGIEQVGFEVEKICQHANLDIQRAWRGGETIAVFQEIKRIAAAAQRDLRHQKRLVIEEERAAKLLAQQRRAKIAGKGQGRGFFVNSRGRAALARGRSIDRQNLASREAIALAACRNLKLELDKLINQLQHKKETADTGIERFRAASRSSNRRETLS